MRNSIKNSVAKVLPEKVCAGSIDYEKELTHSIENSPAHLTLKVADEKLGLLGYVVIDRVLSGPSIGGVRMRDGLTLDEVTGLAREMTLKFSFLNIPCGGAKAGVLWRAFSSDEERRNIFTAFGKQLGPVLIKRMYIPGEDMGTSSLDIYHMKKGAGIDITKPASNNSASGYFTAVTVLISVECLTKSMSFNLSGARVAIDGFGKVGTCVAQLFADAGAKIVGISTIKGGLYNPDGIDIGRFLELKRESGDDAVNFYSHADAIKKESLLALDADIFVPCAGPYTITKENVSQIKSKVVVPGANLAASAEAESIMHERGIHYMPSFVSSCGGILVYALIEQGFSGAGAEKIMKNGFGSNISRLIERSSTENVSLSHKAREIAQRNLSRLEQFAGSDRKQNIGVSLNHRPALWKYYKLSFQFRASRLLRPFAAKYMENVLSQDAPSWTDL
ncbi:MAG: Glu/Leu/Phe/Val dehydrogenase dimerization domain-containing protein [Thermodesulfovibrionales bacterium]|nr:Glu/Leu/Phe/Val dehydrogenase dimerization domain-containing protein [Thermodesulfovibrionales bacterium]